MQDAEKLPLLAFTYASDHGSSLNAACDTHGASMVSARAISAKTAVR